MQKLLVSRSNKEEVQQILSKLEPQKYGKGAYCDMSFTPSKLADHILFREANLLRKIEEEASRNRELEAKTNTLGDQVDYLKRQKKGVENGLHKMITMYKGIIGQMQVKSEQRMVLLQKNFKVQLQRRVKEKGEEAKFVQSEKQILQNRINQLESQTDRFKEDIRLLNRNKDEVQKSLDELTIEHKYLNEKFDVLKQRYEEKCQEAKEESDRLKKEFMNAEIQWKKNLRDEIHKKDLQLQKSERVHKTQLDKAESERKNQVMIKNQELKDLSQAFDSESNRLKEIIDVKDKMIDSLSTELHKQKTRNMSLTRDYEAEINHLVHEKNRLLNEVELYAKDNESIIRERAMVTDDLEKENTKLRDLLYESSVQLQKCQSQLVGLARDNTRLLTRVKSSEEEAKTWRDSYYVNKSRQS